MMIPLQRIDLINTELIGPYVLCFFLRPVTPFLAELGQVSPNLQEAAVDQNTKDRGGRAPGVR